LKVTVFAVLGLVSLMLLVTLGFYLTRPSPEVAALENAIRTLMPRSLQGPERLKEADKKLEKIKEIQADPAFARLPQKSQSEVQHFFQELTAYQKYDSDFKAQVLQPHLAKTEADLLKIEDAMLRLKIPEVYAETWSQTLVDRRYQEFQYDIKILRQEVEKAETVFKDLDRRREELKKVLVQDFPAKRKELLKETEKLPYYQNRTQKIAGSRITYEQILQFDRVISWYRRWEIFRKTPGLGPGG
jgi:replicative superfamily II helicase